jgi:four helix bundle protein
MGSGVEMVISALEWYDPRDARRLSWRSSVSGSERMTVDGYRDLVVYQKAMRLARECYLLAGEFKRESRYIGADLRHSSLIIPAKIARVHNMPECRDRERSFDRAFGKLGRLEGLLEIGEHIGEASPARLAECRLLIDEVRRLLRTLEGKWRD